LFQLVKKNLEGLSRAGSGPSRLNALFSHLIPALGRRALLGGALEHLGTLPLTGQASLAVVRMYDEVLLLGITSQSVTLLTSSREAQIPGSIPSSFQEEQLKLRESAAR
jgi:flagellar biogenesis protein FliO